MKKDWDQLWQTKSDELRHKLKLLFDARAPDASISAREQRIKVLQEQKASYAKLYEKIKVDQKTANDDSFAIAYAQHELTSLLKHEEQLKRNLAQFEFQSRQEPYRTLLVDRAEVPKYPTNNNRLDYMAIAQLAVLLFVIAGFLVSEVNSRRGLRHAAMPADARPIRPA